MQPRLIESCDAGEHIVNERHIRVQHDRTLKGQNCRVAKRSKHKSHRRALGRMLHFAVLVDQPYDHSGQNLRREPKINIAYFKEKPSRATSKALSAHISLSVRHAVGAVCPRPFFISLKKIKQVSRIRRKSHQKKAFPSHCSIGHPGVRFSTMRVGSKVTSRIHAISRWSMSGFLPTAPRVDDWFVRYT